MSGADHPENYEGPTLLPEIEGQPADQDMFEVACGQVIDVMASILEAMSPEDDPSGNWPLPDWALIAERKTEAAQVYLNAHQALSMYREGRAAMERQQVALMEQARHHAAMEEMIKNRPDLLVPVGGRVPPGMH